MAPSPTLEALIRRAVADAGLDPSYEPVVLGYVLDRSDQWRTCCATHCNPCMLELGRIVDRVRSELDS